MKVKGLSEKFPVSKIIVKTYDINEMGTAHVFRDIKLRNQSDKNVDLSIAEFIVAEENTNLVNLKVEDEPKTNFVTAKKNVTGLHSEVVVESQIFFES